MGSHYELSQGYAMNGFPRSHSGVRGWIDGRLAFMSVLVLFAGAATGQPPGGHITPNFRDADFTELVQAVSAATGKNFIIDPRVRARVTMISSTEMSPAAFYDAFLSLLSACGLVVVPGSTVITILPGTRAPGFIWVDFTDIPSFSCVAQ
jgi:type II secretory pathway component GspD/PulD (secretin)